MINGLKSHHKLVIVIAGISLAIFLLLLSARAAAADRMESDSYVVTFGNFNTSSGEQDDGDQYSVTSTVGQLAIGPYGEYGVSNYFVGSGFQYIYQINEFSFTITDVSVELGEIEPGTHSTASHDLIISTKGAGGYLVYAYETHPLRHSNGVEEIVDTPCDAGPCTISNAQPWTNQNIAGFGFNMSGDDVAGDFVDATYFRPFADISAPDDMQIVMSSANVADARTATVTYKAGVGNIQAAGNYQTEVRYVAVPGF